MFFDEYKVALFGHRDLSSYGKTEKRLFFILQKLLETKPFVVFYIGRNGEFDIFSASVIKRFKKASGNENSELTLVLPYTQKDIEYYEKYYDSVIIPEPLQRVHPKRAITERNKWIIEECDLLICYVEKYSGGAYNCLKHAEKLGKRIINLAKDSNFDDE